MGKMDRESNGNRSIWKPLYAILGRLSTLRHFSHGNRNDLPGAKDRAVQNLWLLPKNIWCSRSLKSLLIIVKGKESNSCANVVCDFRSIFGRFSCRGPALTIAFGSVLLLEVNVENETTLRSKLCMNRFPLQCTKSTVVKNSFCNNKIYITSLGPSYAAKICVRWKAFRACCEVLCLHTKRALR